MKNEILNKIRTLVNQVISVLSGSAAGNISGQHRYGEGSEPEIGHNTFHFYDAKKIVL